MAVGLSQGGPLQQTNPTRDKWIKSAYKNVLGREADSSGYSHWYNSNLGNQADIESALRNSGEGVAYKKTQDAAKVNATLYQDPAYVAYMRQMGYDQAAIENKRLADSDRARNMGQIQYDDIDYREGNALSAVGNQYSGRGTYRSGARQMDQAKQATAYGTERNRFALSQAQKQGDLQATASQDLSRLSRDRDEFEIKARNSLYGRDEQGYFPQ